LNSFADTVSSTGKLNVAILYNSFTSKIALSNHKKLLPFLLKAIRIQVTFQSRSYLLAKQD